VNYSKTAKKPEFGSVGALPEAPGDVLSERVTIFISPHAPILGLLALIPGF
jgi:hypothetical protein